MKTRESRRLETKVNGKWTYEGQTFIVKDIYDFLAHELIAKKINKCTYIRSIKRRPLYNGFIEVIVLYNDGVRAIYTIKQ